MATLLHETFCFQDPEIDEKFDASSRSNNLSVKRTASAPQNPVSAPEVSNLERSVTTSAIASTPVRSMKIYLPFNLSVS